MNQDITLEYIHLCDYASLANNGKVNLLGIFDLFLATKVTDFFIATKIRVKTKVEYKISFEIQSSKNNEKIFIDPTPITIPSTTPTLSFNILKQIKGLDFKDFGDYKLVILVNNFPIGFKQVEVKKLETKIS